MVIQTLLDEAAKTLIEYKIPAPRLDAAVLLCHVLEKDRGYLVTHNKDVVTAMQAEQYQSLIKKRAEGTPVAYLTGTKEFMSLPFSVNENVLIPRADSETLVEHVLKENTALSPSIADLCCGSGCIGVSLAYYIGQARVTMVDISREALETAEHNAVQNNVVDRCRFVCTDLIRETLESGFDVVVSNPPYIETDVIDTLDREVRAYEPRLALDGGNDGLVFYRRLANISPSLLKPNGLLALEVGHTQAEAVSALLAEKFYDVKTVCDLAGIRRVVSGRRK